MRYNIKAIKGIATDEKVLDALSRLNRYGSENDEVTVEIKYDKTNQTATCKILGLGKHPVIGKGERPCVAVRDAVKLFTLDVSNDNKKGISANKKDRRTCANRARIKADQDDTKFGR